MASPDVGQRWGLPLALALGLGAAAGSTAPRLMSSMVGPEAAKTAAPLPGAASTADATPPAAAATVRPVLTLIGQSLGMDAAHTLGARTGAASDERLLVQLRQRAVEARIDVDFVVAAIADYVDSNVGWYADWELEAIQAAVVSTGFTFDRFYLPEWPRSVRATASHAHRESPGAIVFRGLVNGRTRLRVVLLVPETPTAGLDRDALQSALTLARIWDADRSGPLRILGPTFSGSIDSLRRVLREDPHIWHARQVRIVTGTATAGSNRRVLENESTAGKTQWITFASTTHPFPEWLRGLKRYLAGINRAWGDGEGMVVLHESNTTFGTAAVKDTNGLLGTFPRARAMAFPLHISRLRDAADAARSASRAALLPSALIPLTSQDGDAATDLLPALTPQLTSASVQTTMASVFDSLRRERYRLVAIVATDERDRLYLAREVRRAAPDTQLVFFGSNMLMLHPDYAPYTRGALVVSSYLLSGSADDWDVSTTGPARRHFASWNAEGLYNATIVLTDGLDLFHYAVPPVPGSVPATDPAPSVEGPPVWISTIGRTGFVGLACYPAERETSPATKSTPPVETFLHLRSLGTASPRAAGERPDWWRVVPLPAWILVAAFVVALGWHVWVVIRQVSAVVTRPRRARAPRDVAAWIAQLQDQRVTGFRRLFVLPWQPLDVRRTATVCVHAVFGVFGLLVAWLTLLIVRAAGSTSYGWPIAVGTLTAAVPLLLAITTRNGTPHRRPAGAHAQGLAFASTVGLMLLAGVPLLALAWGPADLPAAGPIAQLPLMDASRGLTLTTLVSPTVPIVCFALCAYAWLVWQLRVLTVLGAGYTTLFGVTSGTMTAALEATDQPARDDSPASTPGRVARGPVSMTSLLLAGELTAPVSGEGSALARWRLDFTRAFDTTLPTRAWWKPLALALAVVAAVAPLVWARVHTLEGPRFTIVFRIATLGGLGVAALALAQTYGQWQRVGGALGRLGRSPLAPAFSKVRAFQLDWRLNLRLPRRDELALLMRELDALEAILDERAPRERVGRQPFVPEPIVADTMSLADALDQEHQADNLRLLNTVTFMRAWARTERYLPVLRTWFDAPRSVPGWIGTDWLERAQGAVVLTQAFVIRDLLSRIVAGLSTACLCFVLLLAAHLLYTFPGRSTLLTVDWIAVGLSGAMAVSILVGMERSTILSNLWGSDPGRVSFNREFVQRLALYGALPVLTLVSALFPEMGDTLFSWLAPARAIAGF